MHRVRWVMLGLVFAAQAVEAAGGKSIFKLGDYVDHKPLEAMLFYWICFAITVLYENIIEKVNHGVTTHSGKNIVHHVYAEIMILGGISAILTVFENLGGAELFEAALFHFVHFVIFVMAVIFISLITSLFATIDRSWRRWGTFERNAMEVETDPSLLPGERSAFMRQLARTTPEGTRMLACIIFFRESLPAGKPVVSFTRYMKKMQRNMLLDFITFHPRTWLGMSALCLAAAIVTKVTLSISTNPYATMALWGVIVGFGPLILLVVLFFKIRKQFSILITDIRTARQAGHGEVKLRKHFWIKPSFMAYLMQMMLVFQVFYLANVITNFSYRLWIATGPAAALGLILLLFAPTSAVFFFMVPRILPRYAIISSLGEYFDHETLERMWHADQMSGKYRRRAQRERTSGTAPFIDDEDDVLGLKAAHTEPTHDPHDKDAPTGILSDEGMYPAYHAHGHGHGHGHGGHGHGDGDSLDMICEECNKAPARFGCGICGLLCHNCNKDYHKLSMFAHHNPIGIRSAGLFAPDKPIITDNPIINKSRTACALYFKTGDTSDNEFSRKLGHSHGH